MDATTPLTGAREAYRSNECALGAVSYPQLLQLQCYYMQLTMLFDHKIIIIFKIYIIPRSPTSQTPSATVTNKGRRRNANECKPSIRNSAVLICVRTYVSDGYSTRAVHTNVDSGNDGRRAACRNIGQQCVPTRFCNAYERRSTM